MTLLSFVSKIVSNKFSDNRYSHNMLNDLKIKQLKPKDKVYRIADHSGLCIEVRTAGGKFWRFRYRYLNVAKMLTVGQYPEISLAYARTKTMEYREQLAKGMDPRVQQGDERASAIQSSEDTFEVVAIEYCNIKKPLKSKDWYDTRIRYLKKDIYPAIKNKQIAGVDSSDVKTVIDNTIVRIQKSGRGTGEVKATLVRQVIREVIQYAIITGRITNDPTYALKGYIQRPEVEHAKPIELADRKKLMLSISRYGGTESTKNALRVLIYTMLRTIEVRRGLKKYIDFTEKTWTIPVASKAELKTGTRNMKKNRTHIVPLSNQVVSILKTQFEFYPDSDYIFPGESGGMLGKTTLNSAFDNMGFSHITMHDFRATASTDLNEANFNSDWIELQLAHVKGDKTRASYDHAKWLSDRRAMMQDWANMVDAWVGNKADQQEQGCDDYPPIKPQTTIIKSIEPNREKYAAMYYLTNRFECELDNDSLHILVQRELLDFKVDYIKGLVDDLIKMKYRSIDYAAKLDEQGKLNLYEAGKKLSV